MEHLATEDLTKYQMFIIEKRTQQKKYSEICDLFLEKFEIILYDNKLCTALRRASVGYSWAPGMAGGQDPYLCSHDMEELKSAIKDSIEIGYPMDCMDILDEAQKIKFNRIQNAIEFLRCINCMRLSYDFEEAWIQPPTRQWINGVLDELDAHIINRRLIDPKRLDSCSFTVVENFFSQFSAFIASFHPALIFGVDETMIEPLPRKKVVVPKNVKTYLLDSYPEISHITGMMCHGVYGVSLPPFIVLTKLVNIPPDLDTLCQTGQIHLASTNSGYMTRDLFVIWVFHFINFVKVYRSNLSPNLRSRPILLISDGHTSRENPLALHLLNRENIHLLILPAHCTHILQMFDVVIASAFKQSYSKHFDVFFRQTEEDKTITSNVGKVRLASVLSIVAAWKETTSLVFTLKSAQKTGMFPVNQLEVTNSVFVHKLNDKEIKRYNERQIRNQSRININSQIITTPEKIRELTERIGIIPKFKYLCDIDNYSKKDYFSIVKEILSIQHNDAKLLTKLPNVPFAYYNLHPY